MNDLLREPARAFAGAFGAVYLLVGLAGFAVTGSDGWLAAETGDHLLWFQLNPLHNVVHLAIGAALLAGASRPASARVIAVVVGATYAAVGVLGFVAVGEPWNILALNHADNLLHLTTAVLALGSVALAADSATGRAERPATHA